MFEVLALLFSNFLLDPVVHTPCIANLKSATQKACSPAFHNQICLGDSAFLLAQKLPADLTQMSFYDSLRYFEIQEVKFYRLDDLHISILSESKNNKCPICRECYSYGEKIAESTCCGLRTHVACLSMWANQMERESSVASPMPPMHRQDQFSCLGCHCPMHRDTFNQAVNVFFRPYRSMPVVLRRPGTAYRHESRGVPPAVSADSRPEAVIEETYRVSGRCAQGASRNQMQPDLPQPTHLATPVMVQYQSVGPHLVSQRYKTPVQIYSPNLVHVSPHGLNQRQRRRCQSAGRGVPENGGGPMGKLKEGQTDTTESNYVIAGRDLSAESSQGLPARIGSIPGPSFAVRHSQFTSPSTREWKSRVSPAQETSSAATQSNPCTVKSLFTVRPTQTTPSSTKESNPQISFDGTVRMSHIFQR